MAQKLLQIGFGLITAAVVVFLCVSGTPVHAQQLPPPGQYLSPQQLDDLVAPLALYPDPLLSEMLVATTYPVEIVEANQWVQRNPNLRGTALTQSVEQQNWDPSVQALVAFPDVLSFLNEDIAWTTNLGNAFLQQENDVMDAIQRMRFSAQQSGRLSTNAQQLVTPYYDTGGPIIVIEPRDPDVLYVPVYDPMWIWGPSRYYPYPRRVYRPRGTSLYYGGGISLQLTFGSGFQGWNNWGWRPRWNDRTVVVNNTFIHRQNFNSTHLTSFTGTSTWSHDASHRQGVPYPTSALSNRYRTDVRNNLQPRTAQPAGPAATVAPRPVAPNQRVGARNGTPNSPNRDHGYSSLGSNRTNPAPATAVPPRSAFVAPQSPARAPIQEQSPARQHDGPHGNRPERGSTATSPFVPLPGRGPSQAPPPVRGPEPGRGASHVAAQPAPPRQPPPARSEPSKNSSKDPKDSDGRGNRR